MTLAFDTLQWLHEPPQATLTATTAQWQVVGHTDFWRLTHGGAVRDNGHFLYQPQAGEFEAHLHLTGHLVAQYDQAGLMLRLDERTWLKAGVELLEGVRHLSAVVTREASDWSLLPQPAPPAAVWLRLRRYAEYVEMGYSLDGVQYHLLRQAPFPPAAPGQTQLLGLMAAAPTGSGFAVEFGELRVGPLPSAD